MTATLADASALAAMQTAAQALTRAFELAELAGFGSMVLGPIAQSQHELRYALDTASGRN